MERKTTLERTYYIKEFAALARVSERTVRHYEAVGILTPSGRTESGYRLYTDADLNALQHVLALRFLGFSLVEIKHCLKSPAGDLAARLRGQRKMMVDRRQQIDRIIRAIDNAAALVKSGQYDGAAVSRVIEVITMTNTVLKTDIAGVPRFIRGKVRDVYDLGDALLLVTTDRLSAFDVVLPTAIPDKGRVLTQLSSFWFERTTNVVANHAITTDTNAIADRLRKAGAIIDDALISSLEGRSLLAKKCEAIPLECVVRGYLAGSAWADYKKLFAHGGEVLLHGHQLPVGMRESDKLPTPLFTPSTKATVGHDESVTDDQAKAIVGEELFNKLKTTTLALYTEAGNYAAERGIIIADTKFEFGQLGGELILIDEALTPDSSRFWEAAIYQPGKSQPSFDKQYVRDYLQTLDWDKMYPGPELPAEVVKNTSDKYREAYKRIAGKEL